ncbi:hypothetical protein FG93_04324 [Bosea sp. LC85]|nr:hypothetical protein [Bosea sp. LC85]KFC66842.1 hypothetical protein FG93_04324 [Bosea sp. LC85]
MPAITFILGVLLVLVYSPSQKEIVRHALSYCGEDHPENGRPSYCPKSCP